MKRTLLILLGVLLLTGIMLNGQFVSAGNTIMRMLTGKEQAMLSFHSFDGGGPRYSIELDSDIVSYESKKEYDKPDHKRMRGAGYDVIFTFTGLKTGETVVTVKKRSPIHERENEDRKYRLKVDKDLNVTIEPIKPNPVQK